MSKVSFRARALDATKPMPVFRADEIPDLPDFATINRSVPLMPTGMEKEEETEHHLQRALSAQQVYGTSEALVIPIPEVEDIAEKYDQYYKQDFKLGKQYIHIQAFGMDQEIPDYDMDSEDEGWLNEQAKKMEITPLKFEEMMDRLEKGSGQQVVTLQEAKLLLKEDDDLIIAVYDYWLNKRLRTQQPLIATVKTEKRDGSTTNNPYVAFRRRTEKMQTRKNRKNDEVSYEKMLKLRRDLSRAVTLLEVIKRREKSKKELLQLTIEVLEKRYQSEDFDGKLLAHAEAERHKHPSFIPPFSLSKSGEWVQGVNGDIAPKPKKRAYRKRKQSQQQQHHHHHNHHHQTSNITSSHYSEVDILHPDIDSSDDDGLSPGMSPSDHEDENDPDGPFAFKRRKHCHYFTPLMGRQGNWSWCSPDEGGLGDKKYRYSLMSLPPPRNCVGFSRRRVGRGGRVIMDRAYTPWDDGLDRLDLGDPSHSPEVLGEYVTYIRERKIPHFRPKTPPPDSDSRHGSRSPSSTPVSVEFNFETFQSHKEQLLEMKREQEEKLLQLEASEIDSSVILGQSFSSQPTSRFTLDSASAEFAVSAVMNSSQLPSANIGATTTTTTTSTSSSSSNNLTAPSVSLPPVSTSPSSLLSASLTAPPILVTTQTTTPTPPTVAVTTNGPLIDSKTSGLSTSPAANILQLNFPLNVCSVTTAAVTTALTAATSVKVSSASTFMKPTVNNKVMPANTSTFKLSTTPATALNLLKQNHEDHNAVSTFNKDQVLPMDVT
ncbi:enhancer of polycomb homolog 1-like isoform X1 [Haliotis rufescens]|uniref:enhancer of polycomb homolog 1-like isoform X1 n=1 Tax=Haliotis rufescens TaxID=6454 RepID=UPI001EB06479|nr:enhancer of polycomb homolog 1-like isoform X1 [Haliotis rufescens]